MNDYFPPVVYHYCNLNAFKNIVENRAVWLSHISLMNDRTELAWFMDMASSEAEKCISDTSEVSRRFCRCLSTLLLRDPVLSHVYCYSFSDDGDVLSQWRAYADEGAGVAIGFSTDEWTKPGRVHLEKVVYTSKEPREKVSGVIARWLADLNDASKSPEVAAMWCYFHLCEEAPKFKNPAFAEEKELRLIVSCLPNNKLLSSDGTEYDPKLFAAFPSAMEFSVNNGRLRPHFELKFSMDAITEIVFGPKFAAVNDEKVIKLLLSRNKFDGKSITFRHSKAPYR